VPKIRVHAAQRIAVILSRPERFRGSEGLMDADVANRKSFAVYAVRMTNNEHAL
jgi:hypothetical protein